MKSDADLQRHVLEELNWEPSIHAAQIGVTVEKGVVTLTGHVAVYAEKIAAGKVAKRIHGVKRVINEIEVRPTEHHERGDVALAEAVMHILEWDAAVPHDRIQVTVRNGWITLEGTLDWQFQKEAADRAVRHLVGVRGVTNALVVRSSEIAKDVKADIEAALRRSATLNSKKISVEIDGNTVILCGDVRSHAECTEAERTCWRARGVNRVENCLTITPWGCGPAEEWGY